MSRRVSVWWHKQKKAWCTEIDRRRYVLAKGRANKKQASDALAKLLAERVLLSKTNGAISVAGLCEKFLDDAEENLSPATYESYQYACQKLTDALGELDAHTVRSDDISGFSKTLKKTLNNTSRAIVLRSIQRCFNWGSETKLIPPHELGRIRKPRSRLTTEEAAELLDGAAPANVPFVLSDELGSPAVFRVMLAANRAPADAVRHVRTLIDQAERRGKLASWVASRQLGFALLAVNGHHASALEKAVSRSRVLERAAVIIDVGADAEHLAAVLKELKG